MAFIPMSKKILILGGGRLGLALVNKLKNKDNILLLTRSTSSNLQGLNYTTVDASELSNLETVVDEFDAEVIINTISSTNIDYCESNYLAERKNSIKVVENLVKIVEYRESKIVHFSTDHFENDDSEIKRSEDSKFKIVNNYGKLKLEAESMILELKERALVIRTNFFGTSPAGRTSFFEDLIKLLKEEKPYHAFTNIYFTPIWTNQLIECLNNLITGNHSGVYNISGDECVSKFQFACLIAQNLHVSTGLIIPDAYSLANQNFVRRPLNMCLDNSKIKKLNYSINFSLNYGISQAIKEISSK